jgi:hypothetical protein
MPKINFSKIVLFILGTAIFPILGYASVGPAPSTWIEPSSNPPAGNVAPPVNVGSIAQSKSGDLNIGDGLKYWITKSGDSFALKNNAGAIQLIIGQNGNVGIGAANPSEKLEVVGNLIATGNISGLAFYSTSDERLKKNIIPITDSLEKMEKLNGVYFNWKGNNDPSMGLIAQDVEKVFPQAVITNKNTGLKSVDYGMLVAPLIEAIKAQQQEISTLKSQVEELKLKLGAPVN